MYSFVKRNILIALIGVFPMVVGVESAAGHSGGGTSGSSGGHGGGGHGNAGNAGNANSWSGPSGAHSLTAATSAHMSGGHLAASQPHATGDFPAGRFVHTGPAKTAKQRQFASSGYVPNNSVNNDDWRKRHHYRRISSP